MSKSISEMGKEELRAACRTAGISYGKLNNDGMRAALQKVENAAQFGTNLPAATVADKQAEQGIGPVGSDGRPGPVVADVVGMFGKPPADKVVDTPVVDAGPRETVTGKVVKPKSLKIEKGRFKHNGVTQPSTGSICRAIWDALDVKRTADKAVPTFENLRDLMKQYGWSKNTAMTQYQRWKQYNGVMPRTTEEAAEDETKTEE